MKNGARPIRIQPKKQIHKYMRIFGAALPMNDFCVDKNIWWPNQDVDNAPTECVGYTGGDLLADIYGFPFSADWIYMRTLQLEGVPPTTEGSDPHIGLQSLIAFGAPRYKDASVTAAQFGELYIANSENWKNEDQHAALPYIANGAGNALGNGDAFTSIITAVRNLNYGVSVATLWYPQYEEPAFNGTVQSPSNYSDLGLPGHNWVAKGMKTIDGKKYLMCKSHQGRTFGDGGWIYLSQDQVNHMLSVPGTGALTLLMQANRLISLVNIAVEYYPQAIPNIAAMVRAAQGKI